MNHRTADQERAQYDAWIAELEKRRQSLSRSSRRVDALLFVAVATSVPALFVSRWLALVVAGFWIIIVLAGHYLIAMYRWQYALQIERTHSDARKLAHLRAFPEEMDLPQDGDDEERARYRTFRIPRQAVMRMPWQR
jgi:hypothetical protein